jgi:hypothetical protein
VLALPLGRVGDVPQRRPADERPADRRKAAPRGLPAPVRIAKLRPSDPAASLHGGEISEDRDGVRVRARIRVRDPELVLYRWKRHARHFDRAAERLSPQVARPGQLALERHVRHDDNLVDLRRECSEAARGRADGRA